MGFNDVARSRVKIWVFVHWPKSRLWDIDRHVHWFARLVIDAAIAASVMTALAVIAFWFSRRPLRVCFRYSGA
jgi:hypothetical protein